MKYIFPKSILVFCIISVLSNATFAANYAWTGATSVNWSTSTNWNPNGVPSSSDTVTISNQTNNPKLNANTTVKKITMTSGTLDLNTFKLTISNYGYFNGGSINNGMVYQSAFSNSSINFSGTTFGAKVSISGTVVSMISTTFSDSVTITQSGSPLSAKGGNTFNGPAYFSSSLSSSIVFSDSLPDTFNSTLEINNTGTGAFYIAHRGTGNQFNGNVKFTGQNIYSNYYGTATYSQNINIYSFSSKGKKWSSVYFGYSTGSCLLATGKTITIDTTATRGAYCFQNFTQQGSGSINFSASDSVHFYFNPGTTFNAAITCSAPFIHLDGAKFNSTANFTNNANMNVTSLGGGYFGGTTTITNNTTGSNTFTIGGTLPDTFQTSAMIQNNTGILSINNAIFNGTAYLNNYDSSTTNNRFFVNNTGQTVFHGPLVIDNIKSGMSFGGLYPLVVDCIDCFDMNDVSSGVVTYRNMTVSSDVVIVSQLANGKLVLDSGNTFNGKFTFIGHDIEVKGSVFNDEVNITKTGSTDNTWYGANVFNAQTTITDSSTSGHWLKMAEAASDTFYADIVFRQVGAGMMKPAYNFPYYISGNLSVDGTSAITFGTNAGIVFRGSNSQSISKLASYAPTLKNLEINKASNSLNLNTPIIITDEIIFTKGFINTDATNLLTLNHGGIVSDASDLSFVIGPMSKIGNTAFTFPSGYNASSKGYHPLSISAPGTTSDKFTVKYLHSSSGISDDNLSDDFEMSTCEHWTIKHDVGSSDVQITLAFDISLCSIAIDTTLTVAFHNGTSWIDLGRETVDSNDGKGTISTQDNVATSTTERQLTLASNALAFSSCSGLANWHNYNISSHPGSTISNAPIYISGTLTIDKNFTFIGCRFRMAPDAIISIPADKKLTLINCHLYSCDGINMWTGIQLNGSTNLSLHPLSLEMQSTVVEDAEFAVSVSANNGIKIVNCNLNKNYTAINFDGTTGTQSTLEIYGTSITSYGNYLDSLTRGSVCLLPHPGITAFGISVQSLSSINIGNPNESANFFDGIGNTIVIYQTDATIKNNVFYYGGFSPIISVDNGAPLTNNYTYSLRVGGNGTGEKNIFNHGVNGILTTNRTNTIIEGNIFYSIQKSITLNNTTGRPINIDINHNEFWHFDEYGIQLKRMTGISTGNISFNRFNPQDDLTHKDLKGIWINNFSTRTSNLHINNNEIWNCTVGIKALKLHTNCEVNNNEIYFPDLLPSPYQYFGIQVNSSNNTTIAGNTFLRTTTATNVWVTGLDLEDLSWCKVYSNNFINGTTSFMRGILLQGVNTGTQFSCNYYAGCREACRWETFPGPIQTMVAHQGTANDPTDDQWSDPTVGPFQRVPSFTNSFNWHFNNDLGFGLVNEYFPESTNLAITPIPENTHRTCEDPPSFIASRDIDPVISEDFEFDDFQDDYQYGLNETVYSFLSKNQEWISTYDYDVWYETIKESNIGKFYQIEELSSNYYESASNPGEAYEDSLELAIEILSNITPDNNIEENLYTFYSIMFNKVIQNINLDEEDIDNLENIACQDIITGGKAVLWAREFMEIEMDDSSGCILNNLRFGKSNVMHSSTKLYPNPTNGELHIKGNNLNYDLTIFDIFGKQLKIFHNLTNNEKFHCDLSVGCYLYKLYSKETGEVFNGKLIVN